MTKTPKQPNKIFLILHNIRSTHNVGSIFRTADAVGVSKIYLTGYTPSPFDRLGKLEKNFSKTALGAEKSVEWCSIKTLTPLLNKLKKPARPGGTGVNIVALEQDPHATIYSMFKPQFPLALILGNEITGIDKSVLKKCDHIIEIPMSGQKESLNVSVAAGVALFSLK
jgi:tRNA G18 (ribose-2'-O)-methylase SpoU